MTAALLMQLALIALQSSALSAELATTATSWLPLCSSVSDPADDAPAHNPIPHCPACPGAADPSLRAPMPRIGVATLVSMTDVPSAKTPPPRAATARPFQPRGPPLYLC